MNVNGFYFAGIHSGIKDNASRDLGLIYAPDGAACAAAFTVNRFKASHILLDVPRLRRGRCRAVLVNSGNANACTGKEGLEDARRLTAVLARELEISAQDVLMASTGLIGQRLPVKKIEKRIPVLIRSLSRLRVEHFAEAIMTTDHFMKIREVEISSLGVKILGLAKGAGMIHPHMSTATMLAFLLTDAEATHLDLRSVIDAVVDETFNSISVDGQMSTNDSFFVLANGKSGVKVSTGKEMALFQSAVKDVCASLAELIVRDGEGATCVIEVEVRGARTRVDAQNVARTIATSALVKTAFHGGEENWGRIVQALGTTRASFRPEKVKIYVNGRLYFSEGKGRSTLRRKRREKHRVVIDLAAGAASARFLTSDLSEQYVRINAEHLT